MTKSVISSVTNFLPLVFLRFYKRFISPLLPQACRFHPTCSVYAMECFSRFHFFKATYLTVWRLCRCHPFHPGGEDPVGE